MFLKCPDCCGYGDTKTASDNGDTRCLDCGRLLLIGDSLIPRNPDDVIEFIGNNFSVLEKSGNDVLNWKYTMTVGEMISAFDNFVTSNSEGRGIDIATNVSHNRR